MVRLSGFCLLLSLWAPLAISQDCSDRALKTVDRAKLSALKGDTKAAVSWLDQAGKECSTSSAVFLEISKVYEQLGNKTMASFYATQAEQLSPNLRFRQPGEPPAGSGSPANVPGRDPTVDDKSFVREKWALVVGVGRFQEKNIPQLDCAAKDAADFAAMLADPKVGRFRDDPEHILLLTDEKATVANVRSAINQIARNARAEDLVVLYFSSHGSSSDMDVATERGQTGYIVTYDTKIDDLYATAFPMRELQQVVDDRFKSARVVTFLDTCYSGDTISRARGGKALITAISTDSIARVAQGKGRVVIASSQNNEKSWESEAYKNSYFTHYLLEAMRATGGNATVTQLFTYLQRFVTPAVRKEKNEPQNPIMYPEGREISVVIGTAIK
jgi:hypothetical protein